MTLDFYLFTILLAATLFLSFKKGKLTAGGTAMAAIIGSCIFIGAGFTGIAMTGLFFLLSVLATSWNFKFKQQIGVAEDGGKRTAGQVFANGGVAALAGLAAWLFPAANPLFQLMMAAALSAATADTISSELGTVYGKRFYDILSFKRAIRGENGVVSVEGTLFGIAGSLLIAILYAVGNGFNWRLGTIVVAGTIGNLADSLLGASLERKHLLNNNAVNFINTLTGAITALLINQIFM